jgi:Flp pilus assembly protein TadD
VHAAPPSIDAAALVAFFANYQDLYWLLDEDQQQLLLSLSPVAFDNDPGTWSIVRAQTYYVRGDQARARIYADSSRVVIEQQLRGAPNDGQLHTFRGLALAYLGRKDEAIKEGIRGTELWPMSRDANQGTYLQHQLARIYTLTGKPEKAIDVLERILAVPYYVSPGWLRVDPSFAALKGNPRFDRLIAGN